MERVKKVIKAKTIFQNLTKRPEEKLYSKYLEEQLVYSWPDDLLKVYYTFSEDWREYAQIAYEHFLKKGIRQMGNGSCAELSVKLTDWLRNHNYQVSTKK